MAPSKVQDEVQGILDTACADSEALPGAVFVMMDRNGDYLVKAAAGVRGLDKKDQKMTTDTAFVGFSCTKLITAMACLQLVEQGKVELDAPVDIFLTELADVKLIDGTTPKRKITLRMLLSHTAGYAYNFFNQEINDWTTANQPFDSAKWETFNQALIAQPGEDWNYGIAMDWAGKLVERVSGQTLGEYCKDHIFDPLGCKDIQFNRVPKQCENRLASMHLRLPEGNLIRIEHQPAFVQGTFHSGGAGCIITAEDYTKILFVLINEGKGHNGVRVLEPKTVDEMFRDQLAGTPAGKNRALERTIPAVIPQLTNPVVPLPGVEKGWSFAGMLTKDPLPSGRSGNSVWWAGLGNLYWMADREKGLVNVIMSQYFPFYDPHTLDPYRAAEKAVYDSLL